MEKKVDIIMATYNTDVSYLRQQIDSILNQTYKNINLIISDDNSSNKEIQEVIKEYEQKDNRVKVYIQNKNIGYIHNFEFLLKKSQSEYIMYSDHDDIWYENKVEESIKKIKKENVDLVYCNSTQINDEGKIIKDSYFKYKNVPLIKGKSKLAISRCIGIGCSQLFTKNVKDKMIPFKNKVIAHDWLAAFIANEEKGIAYIEDKLFGYRLHNSNVFGGRTLAQNLNRWKKENGTTYKAYLKYRKEKVIDMAYLDGAKMCLEYSKNKQNQEFLNQIIKYYTKLENSRYINIHLIKYFKFLSGKNLLKKMIKEIAIFHFPILGYLLYRIG